MNGMSHMVGVFVTLLSSPDPTLSQGMNGMSYMVGVFVTLLSSPDPTLSQGKVVW